METIITGRKGIYFLMHLGKVVYIGATRDFPRRMIGHYDKKFDCIKFIECEDNKYYERRWMELFKPKYNTQTFTIDWRRKLIKEKKYSVSECKFINDY